MKQLKFIFTLTVLLVTTYAFGQQDIRDKEHAFRYRIELERCSFDGEIKTTKQVMNEDWKFEIVKVIDQKDYVIRVLKFTSGTDAAKTLNAKTYFDTTTNEEIYFFLSKENFKDYAIEIKRSGSFLVGASTSLLKVRPGRTSNNNRDAIFSEFGNDFNIGLTAGWQFTSWKKNISAAALVGMGYSAIKVTPQTTRNTITTESTQSAITISGGVYFEIQRFQLSIFTGLDIMSGEIGTQWIFKDRPWIGLGFGFEIFQPNSNSNGSVD